MSFRCWVGESCFLHFENWYLVMALRELNFRLLDDFWLQDLSWGSGSILSCSGSYSSWLLWSLRSLGLSPKGIAVRWAQQAWSFRLPAFGTFEIGGFEALAGLCFESMRSNLESWQGFLFHRRSPGEAFVANPSCPLERVDAWLTELLFCSAFCSRLHLVQGG